MDIEKRIELVTRAPIEETLTIADLRELLQREERPVHYQGFEISGHLHLGTLILSGFKINDLSEAGFKTKVLLADWHSILNKKLGGDWDKILKAAKYYKEAFKFFCPKTEIVLGSELYHNNDDYWKNVMRFSLQISLARCSRCLTIMGRSENEKLDLAQYFYPPMQAVDIAAIGAHLAHGGMDQRKIHVLAREVYPHLGWKKPIAIHHHLLPGLAEPPKISDPTNKEERTLAAKMSKSKPWTAIFVHDTKEEIKEKMKKAYCPPQVEDNPVLELAKYVVFHEFESVTVYRESKFGGDVTFNSYAELEEAYINKKIHPMDLKNCIAEHIDKIIEPVRKHFENKKELLEVYKEVEITR
ncbi:MAG: tyrosine--tRNA ligase [Candidatus Bilamarchaeaceae archaeon]